MNTQRIRKDFPLTRRMIYLNSAAVGPNPIPVVEAGRRFQHRKNWEHPERLPEWLASLDTARRAIADLIGAKPHEIALTTNTDDGLNIVANGFTRLRRGDVVLSDDLDFPSTPIVWRAMERRRGLRFDTVGHREGAVITEDFAAALGRRTRMISVTLVSHVNGYLRDARGLADLIHARGGYLFLDAVQAVGNIPVNVKTLDVDFLSCAAYKWLLGPLGLAFLYVREELLDDVVAPFNGWMQRERFVKPAPETFYIDARKFEYGTLHFQGVSELLAAMDYRKRAGFRETSAAAVRLGLLLQHKLRDAGFRLFTPMGNKTPIVTFYTEDGYGLSKRLLAKGISVMGRPKNVRVSPNFFNTEEELDTLVRELQRMKRS